jgi:hypothetical protein
LKATSGLPQCSYLQESAAGCKAARTRTVQAILSHRAKRRACAAAAFVLFCAAGNFAGVAAAQEQRTAQAPPLTTTAGPLKQTSGITNDPPDIPVEEIIRRFGERESEFRKERENFAYEQSFLVQSFDANGVPNGEYRMDSDILFTSTGKRYERVIYAPLPTLQGFSLTQQDLKDLENVQPFVLTTEDLPKYDVRYLGREQIDEISTYVFDVAPKKIEKDQRYFQGRIWVDDRDMEIVKTFGKAVPDIKKGDNENVFPHFVTYRENIEKNYWFPTYTRADDMLNFRYASLRIRMIVRYRNYKRFVSSGKIVGPAEPVPDKP